MESGHAREQTRVCSSRCLTMPMSLVHAEHRNTATQTGHLFPPHPCAGCEQFPRLQKTNKTTLCWHLALGLALVLCTLSASRNILYPGHGDERATVTKRGVVGPGCKRVSLTVSYRLHTDALSGNDSSGSYSSLSIEVHHPNYHGIWLQVPGAFHTLAQRFTIRGMRAHAAQNTSSSPSCKTEWRGAHNFDGSKDESMNKLHARDRGNKCNIPLT